MNALHPVAPGSYPVAGEPFKKPALQGARQPANNGLGDRPRPRAGCPAPTNEWVMDGRGGTGRPTTFRFAEPRGGRPVSSLFGS